jgi:hypothetical protein
MTQLEALKSACLLAGDQAMTALPKPEHLKWVEVVDTLQALIEEVEAAEADPDIALEQAEAVMHEKGRYVTFWVSREWIVEYCSDQHMPPNAEELVSIADWLLASQDIGTTEAASMALDEWMQQHWAP